MKEVIYAEPFIMPIHGVQIRQRQKGHTTHVQIVARVSQCISKHAKNVVQ